MRNQFKKIPIPGVLLQRKVVAVDEVLIKKAQQAAGECEDEEDRGNFLKEAKTLSLFKVSDGWLA